jgi:hypothetical protein
VDRAPGPGKQISLHAVTYSDSEHTFTSCSQETRAINLQPLCSVHSAHDWKGNTDLTWTHFHAVTLQEVQSHLWTSCFKATQTIPTRNSQRGSRIDRTQLHFSLLPCVTCSERSPEQCFPNSTNYEVLIMKCPLLVTSCLLHSLIFSSLRSQTLLIHVLYLRWHTTFYVHGNRWNYIFEHFNLGTFRQETRSHSIFIGSDHIAIWIYSRCFRVM